MCRLKTASSGYVSSEVWAYERLVQSRQLAAAAVICVVPCGHIIGQLATAILGGLSGSSAVVSKHHAALAVVRACCTWRTDPPMQGRRRGHKLTGLCTYVGSRSSTRCTASHYWGLFNLKLPYTLAHVRDCKPALSGLTACIGPALHLRREAG